MCWRKSLEDFQKPSSVDDIDDFCSGSIQDIIVYKHHDVTSFYVKVTKFTTLRYEVGGTWVVDTESDSKCFLPLRYVSESLIVGSHPAIANQLHILNSKMTLSPIEAKTWLDHTGASM